jgi:hypothetical protein
MRQFCSSASSFCHIIFTKFNDLLASQLFSRYFGFMQLFHGPASMMKTRSLLFNVLSLYSSQLSDGPEFSTGSQTKQPTNVAKLGAMLCTDQATLHLSPCEIHLYDKHLELYVFLHLSKCTHFII